jgi:methionyl-tRNA synthetase
MASVEEVADDDASPSHVIYIWVQAINAYFVVVQQATQGQEYRSACVVKKTSVFYAVLKICLAS